MGRLEIVGCENCNAIERDEDEIVWGGGQAEAIPDWLRDSKCPRCQTLFNTIDLIFVGPTPTNEIKHEYTKAAAAVFETVPSSTVSLISIRAHYDTDKQEQRNAFFRIQRG